MLKKQLNRRALMQQMVAIGSAALAAGTAANTLLANAAQYAPVLFRSVVFSNLNIHIPEPSEPSRFPYLTSYAMLNKYANKGELM